MRAWWICGCLAVGCLGLFGCGRTQPASSRPVQNETEEAVRTPLSHRGTAEMAPLTRPLQPGAAGAVELALEGFRTGHLEIAFDFLPPSYQQDVNRLVQDFAKRVDPQLWGQVNAVSHKGVRVLQVKKSLLIPMIPHPGGAPSGVVSETWDEFTKAAEEFTRSDFTKLDHLQRIDVREFLRKDAGRVLRRLMTLSAIANPGGPTPLTELEQVQVDLVESTTTTALVRITPPGKSDVPPTEFVKVEGRWIPKSLAENWSQTVEAARLQIEVLSSETVLERTEHLRDFLRVMDFLRVLDGVFDQMLIAETTDQLAAAATPLFLQAAQLPNPLTASPSPIPEGPPEGVSILIARELTDDELTRLLQILEPLTDDPEREYHLATANGGKTYISIKPVHDVAAFAAKLTFAKEPVIDETARTITVRDVMWK